MRKIIWKMEYFINSTIYQMLKFFKRITSFYPDMILRPLFCIADTKKYRFINIQLFESKEINF